MLSLSDPAPGVGARGRAAAWSTSGLVLAAGLALAGAMLLAFLGIFLHERERAVERELAQHAMFARVLEDHVTRNVETASLSLSNLGGALEDQGFGGGAMQVGALRQTLVSLPHLRALAVIDSQGRVLGSSVPAEVGVVIDLKRLGPLPRSGAERLGSYVAARTLGELAPGSEQIAPVSTGFVPLLRRQPTRDGDWLLVALLHPEGIANFMRLTLQQPDTVGTVATYAGEVIASTGRLLPGESVAGTAVFRDQLPAREHASYLGTGIEPGRQTAAFRVSRSRPLVVIVERPLAGVQAEWRSGSAARQVIAALAVTAVVVLTLTASRSLRTREQVRLRLDQSQAQVMQSERDLGVIVRSVQELLFRTDAQGVLTFVNSQWEASAGRPVDSFVGSAFIDLVTEGERADVLRLFDTASPLGVRKASLTFWSAGNLPRRFDVAAVPLHDGLRITGFAGSGVDITERLEAESKLKAQLAFTEQMMDSSPLPTSMTDRTGRYLFVNRAWEAFTGRRRTDAIGQPTGAHLPAAQALHHAAVDREVLASGQPVTLETQLPRQDGALRDVIVTKLVVPGQHGEASGVLSTVVDVTEFREAEQATRAGRLAAEEASAAKSEFIANVSHELRTPLQSIMGFSELGTLRPAGGERAAMMFADILAAGRRMLTLVNDLLDVSKLESMVGSMHFERTDVRPLLREVQRELMPLLDAKQLSLAMHLPTFGLTARIDPARLQQVVRNMLANAIKFSPPGLPIEVEAGVAEDDGIFIRVRDHGPGIPPDELEKIFEAFVQSSKTKDGSGGSGLGLTISRTIVAAHGGSMHAENMPDGGCRFSVRLPSCSSAETRPPELTS